MAKLTKTQARKRILEAKAKIMKVALHFPSPALSLTRATKMADELQKIANKLK
tara:strand:+ start:4040 stop:4198 length:159 start_codon:yes stop_codon:yes gene_type:complete